MSDNKSIIRSTTSLMLLTIAVKLCGIIKQSVIAFYFGTNSEMDMYFIASDFLIEVGMVFFSALTINLVNIYLEEKEKSKEEANSIFTDTTICFALMSIVISFAMFISPHFLAKLLAPGADEQSISNLIKFLRLFSLALVCVAINNICTAVLNAEKEFLPGKCVGLIQSASVVFFCVFFYKRLGILSLVVGTLLFFILQDVFLLIRVKKYVNFCMPKMFKNPRIKELIILWIPLFLSNSVIQLNAMIDKAIATSLGEGGVSALSYGHFVFTSIHSILIMNVCTVLFSFFSSYILENKTTELINTFRDSISLMVFMMIPITVLCLGESENIIKILYGRGAFGEDSIQMTKSALVGYATGIVFVTVRDIIMQVLYAYKKNKIAMVNGIVGVVFNIALSVVLSKKSGIIGIALADSIAYLIVALIGCVEIKKEIKGIWSANLAKDIFPSVLFSSISLIPLLCVKKYFHINLYADFIMECGCFVTCFALLLIVTKNDAVKRVLRIVRK